MYATLVYLIVELVVALLPTLFPKNAYLKWINDGDRGTLGPSKVVYATVLQQWKDVECLVDYTKHLNIATHLLENTRCDKLTYLQISFNDSTLVTDVGASRKVMDRDLLQELIKNIHNAPSLVHVSFSKTAIKLIDMDNLHASLHQLEIIILESVYLDRDDRTSNTTQITSNSVVSFLLLKFFVVDLSMQGKTDAAIN